MSFDSMSTKLALRVKKKKPRPPRELRDWMIRLTKWAGPLFEQRALALFVFPMFGAAFQLPQAEGQFMQSTEATAQPIPPPTKFVGHSFRSSGHCPDLERKGPPHGLPHDGVGQGLPP